MFVKNKSMNKTYQPFIIKKANEVLEILKEEVKASERAKETLCTILTQKFIDGKLSEEDDVDCIFESEDEILEFINLCDLNDDLMVLHDLGFIGVLEENYEESFFLTKKGKLYAKALKQN